MAAIVVDAPGGSSSSSGGVPAAPLVLKPCEMIEDDLCDVLSHDGRIFADQSLDGAWWLIDTLTLEVRRLPDSASWDLIVHPDTGRAVAVSASEDVIIVDEFMMKNMYKQPISGELVLCETKADGTFSQKVFSGMSLKMREATLSLKAGNSIAFFDMSVYVFLRERAAGSRLFFNIMALYRVLCLSQYKGQATKWFYQQQKSWLKRLVLVLGAGHIVASNACSGLDDSVPFAQRCLPRSGEQPMLQWNVLDSEKPFACV
jgi:hypothetical protein